MQIALILTEMNKFGAVNSTIKKCALVTLCNEDYILQAKQLFASIYWNARWNGDYVLLTINTPEAKLDWFRHRNVVIFNLNEYIDETISHLMQNVKLYKFFVFHRFFKHWENIIYLDGDIIVRGPLDHLKTVKKFSAVKKQRLAEMIRPAAFPKFINPTKRGFNSGVMAFNTKLIRPDSLQKLINLYLLYKNDLILIDQPIFNLFLWGKVQYLPQIYNYNPGLCGKLHKLFDNKNEHKKAIILHFDGKEKPWQRSNRFYKEWNENLKKADDIFSFTQLPKICNRSKKYPIYEIYINSLYFEVLIMIDRLLGLIGVIVRKYLQRLKSLIVAFLKI